MLEIKISGDTKTGKCQAAAHVCGDLEQIIEESGIAINAVYKGVAKNRKENAKLYRKAMIARLTDPESPVWGLGPAENESFIDLAEMRRQMEDE